MEKRVIVIASGDTERLAIPHMLSFLEGQGIYLIQVVVPPNQRALNLEMAEKLIKGAWYRNIATPPHKFVVLLDLDGKDADEVLGLFRERLWGRLGGAIEAQVLYAYAQRHLEAWFFADAANLETYFAGRALGHVDTSKPDEIEAPKMHLKNLLASRNYTARVAADIAIKLDSHTIAQRSPSFQGFLEAVINGDPSVEEASC